MPTRIPGISAHHDSPHMLVVAELRQENRCFMRTDMDVLLLEHFNVEKSAQPRTTTEDESWQTELALD